MPDTPADTRFELAPQDRLARVEHLAPRFFREVLGWGYHECLVTNESALADFATATAPPEERVVEIDGFFSRMREHYFLDGRRAGSTRIVHLLEFLAAQGISE